LAGLRLKSEDPPVLILSGGFAVSDTSVGDRVVWEPVYRRTNDPKLAYLEYRLDLLMIRHRRNGESAHAPILEVPDENLQEAWDLLNEPIDEDEQGRVIRLDDLEDDDALFDDFLEPF
jgi:hypothetical protein